MINLVMIVTLMVLLIRKRRTRLKFDIEL